MNILRILYRKPVGDYTRRWLKWRVKHWFYYIFLEIYQKKNVFSFWKRLYWHWPLEICSIWRLNTSTYLLLDEGLIEKSTKHILAIIRYFLDCCTSQILKRNSLLYCILLKHIYSVNINTTICILSVKWV